MLTSVILVITDAIDIVIVVIVVVLHWPQVTRLP